MRTTRDDAIWYLRNRFGQSAVSLFQSYTSDNQRDGQAFMNVLREMDVDEYNRLTGSFSDPFYRDSRIPEAVDILTTKEKT